MTKDEALRMALEFAEYCIEELDLSYMASNQAKRLMDKAKEALAQPEQEKERCVGCEACIDTACGRDECPKGWPKAAQPEQESVAMADYMAIVEKYAFLKASQRTWVGLTPEEVKEISLANRPYVVDMVVALEARLKEKNHGT